MAYYRGDCCRICGLVVYVFCYTINLDPEIKDRRVLKWYFYRANIADGPLIAYCALVTNVPDAGSLKDNFETI